MSAAISIITPNYNGEKYLSECLDSVKNQTIDKDNIEVIFVDDGSTDGSREIVESYIQDIPGLRPIWHEHIGKPGELRNIAMSKAIGKHVLFMDSDDFLGSEALQRLHEFSQEYPSDLTAFQIEGLNRDVMRLTETVPYADLIESNLYKTRGIWKMCDRDFIIRNGIRFPNVNRGDDVLFFTDVMLNASTTSILGGYPFYTVRGRDDGSSITQEKWPHQDRISLARAMAQMILAHGGADKRTKDYLMLRAFNADSIAVLRDADASDEDLGVLRSSLGEFWNGDIKSIFYNMDNLHAIEDFYDGAGNHG
jgi:glycosyltransferase involved in cell wall biosynthesis